MCGSTSRQAAIALVFQPLGISKLHALASPLPLYTFHNCLYRISLLFMPGCNRPVESARGKTLQISQTSLTPCTLYKSMDGIQLNHAAHTGISLQSMMAISEALHATCSPQARKNRACNTLRPPSSSIAVMITSCATSFSG